MPREPIVQVQHLDSTNKQPNRADHERRKDVDTEVEGNGRTGDVSKTAYRCIIGNQENLAEDEPDKAKGDDALDVAFGSRG